MSSTFSNNLFVFYHLDNFNSVLRLSIVVIKFKCSCLDADHDNTIFENRPIRNRISTGVFGMRSRWRGVDDPSQNVPTILIILRSGTPNVCLFFIILSVLFFSSPFGSSGATHEFSDEKTTKKKSRCAVTPHGYNSGTYKLWLSRI